MELSAELCGDILASAPGGAQPPQGMDERRRAPRPIMRFDTRIIFRRDGAPPRVMQTTNLDFSPRGVGITQILPMQRGQQFVLMLPGKKGNVSLLCAVTHCARGAGQTYHMGAEFICPVEPSKPAPREDELERIRKFILT